MLFLPACILLHALLVSADLTKSSGESSYRENLLATLTVALPDASTIGALSQGKDGPLFWSPSYCEIETCTFNSKKCSACREVTTCLHKRSPYEVDSGKTDKSCDPFENCGRADGPCECKGCSDYCTTQIQLGAFANRHDCYSSRCPNCHCSACINYCENTLHLSSEETLDCLKQHCSACARCASCGNYCLTKATDADECFQSRCPDCNA